MTNYTSIYDMHNLLINIFFPTLEVQQVRDVQVETGLLLMGWPIHSMFTGELDESAKTLDLCVHYTHLKTVEQMVLQSGYNLTQTHHRYKGDEEDEKHSTELLLNFNNSLKEILRTNNTYTRDMTKVRIRKCRGPPIKTILLSNTNTFVYCLYPRATVAKKITIRGCRHNSSAIIILPTVDRVEADPRVDYRNQDRYIGDQHSWMIPTIKTLKDTSFSSLHGDLRNKVPQGHSWRLEYQAERDAMQGFKMRYAILRHSQWEDMYCISEWVACALHRDMLAWTPEIYIDHILQTCSSP
ncbi:hypothetical protein EV421DRAFT_1743929 [Armillaria borealis]|uniref:Uncharacterized protein n=1 Tax=Armillaria borealis TaxID=47425 RepID=A0AA39IVD8_9AGAR|nr:hypothetical protein EV421DRAFT_1743929 [Armillaria borealis]